MTKLIIFDLDGTLLNTLQDLTNSVNYAMDILSLPKYDCNQVKSMVGNGVAVLMQRAVGLKHIEKSAVALQLQRQYYNKHTDDNTSTYDGVVETLLKLKLNGYTVAVHTNKDEVCARRLVDRFFRNLVDYVIGTTDSVTKPNPVKILNLLQKEKISKTRAVYCGDSDVDILTARNAGLRCISVTWGFKSREFLIANGAHYLADTPSQIIDIAEELLK